MLTYILSFSWGICILLSLIGWGTTINYTLFSKYQIDWGQRAAWGLAFSVSVGGVLNVTSSISRTVVLLYLGMGILFWLIALSRRGPLVINSLYCQIRRHKNDKILAIGVLIVCFLCGLQYAGLVSTGQRVGPVTPTNFNAHDDFQAYFVFPNKMLQIGSMGPDPFSARRITASLGGQSFSHTFVLSLLPERNLHIIDPGLGMLIVVGLLIGYFKDLNTSPRIAVFILLLFFLIPPPTVNITSLVTGLALFLSLFRTLAWKELDSNHFLARSMILGMITAAICSLKSSLIPACGILFISSYFFYIVGSKLKREAILEVVTTTVLVVLFLLPWMISMYQSSGTLLYPLLGKGYHGSVYGTFLLPYSESTLFSSVRALIKSMGEPLLVTLGLLGVLDVASRSWEAAGRQASLALLVSAVLGTVILTMSLGGHDIYRFTFAFVSASVVVSITRVLTSIGLRRRGKFEAFASVFAAALSAGIVIGASWSDSKLMYLGLIGSIRSGLQNRPLVTDKEAEQHSKMQRFIPEGETILARLEKPFLLDFKRNKILIADWPGGASLPPGMPFFKGSEALADYLISQSIRYLAYSYATEAAFSKKVFARRLGPEQHPWNRTEAQHTFDFQDNLQELGMTRKRIYDDGSLFVLDLLEQRKEQVTYSGPQPMDTAITKPSLYVVRLRT